MTTTSLGLTVLLAAVGAAGAAGCSSAPSMGRGGESLWGFHAGRVAFYRQASGMDLPAYEDPYGTEYHALGGPVTVARAPGGRKPKPRSAPERREPAKQASRPITGGTVATWFADAMRTAGRGLLWFLVYFVTLGAVR